MKSLLVTFFTFILSVNCYGQDYELWPEDSKINIDGTQTINNPRLIRGNRSYLVSGSPEGICRALGFDEYLPDSGFTGVTNEQVAVIDAKGIYSSLTTPSGNRFYRTISCFRNSMQKTVVKTSRFDENNDRTVTFMEPRLVRGSFSYYVSGSPEGICRALGYDNYLADTGFTGVTNEQVAIVSAPGSYQSLTTPSGNRFYREITCYSRRPLTILKDSRGDYYFKRN